MDSDQRATIDQARKDAPGGVTSLGVAAEAGLVAVSAKVRPRVLDPIATPLKSHPRGQVSRTDEQLFLLSMLGDLSITATYLAGTLASEAATRTAGPLRDQWPTANDAAGKSHWQSWRGHDRLQSPCTGAGSAAFTTHAFDDRMASHGTPRPPRRKERMMTCIEQRR